MHFAQRSNLVADKDSQFNQGRINQATMRRLCHAVLNSKLNRFALVKNNVSTIERWFDTKKHDYDASVFHRRTRSNEYSPVYSDRLSMSYHMTASSVKLSFLAKIC